MSEKITNVQFQFNCPANWNSMKVMGDCKFCSICQKKVYDFTDKKADDLKKLLLKNKGNICGHFSMHQVIWKPNRFFGKDGCRQHLSC